MQQNFRDGESGIAGARAVPEGFSDVHVFGAMARENVGETGAAQILGVLLANPGSVLSRFCLPIESGVFEIAAAGVAFQNDRWRWKRA